MLAILKKTFEKNKRTFAKYYIFANCGKFAKKIIFDL